MVTATITKGVIGKNTANFSVSNISSTVELNDYVYLSTINTDNTNVLSSYTEYVRSDVVDITLDGLSPNTLYNYYLYVRSTDDIFYNIGTVSFTTDANRYSASLVANNINQTTATVILFSISPITNVDSVVYLSTKSNTSTTDLDYDFSNTRINADAAIDLTGLTPNTKYTYYGYVYSTASKTYYRVGKVTFTTDSDVYNADLSVINLSSTTATVNITNITPTTNLDNEIDLTVTNIIRVDGTSGTVGDQTSYTGVRTEDSGTVDMTNLTPSTTYTCDVGVTSEQSYVYFPVGQITFSTDASSYTATITVDDVSQDQATVNISKLSSIINLNDKVYLSTEDVSSASSLNIQYMGTRTDRSGYVNITGLTANTDYSYNVYIRSSASALYYKIGNISFTTVSNYIADVIDYNHTNKSVILFITNLSDMTDLDGKWYVCDSSNPDTIITSANIGEECLLSDLSPETIYNFIIKVNNTRVNKYYTAAYVSTSTLPKISDKFYYGDVFVYNGTSWDECDVFVRNENDEWEEEHPVLGVF